MLKTNRAQQRNTLMSLRTARIEREAQDIRTEQRLFLSAVLKSCLPHVCRMKSHFDALINERKGKMSEVVFGALCAKSPNH